MDAWEDVPIGQVENIKESGFSWDWSFKKLFKTSISDSGIVNPHPPDTLLRSFTSMKSGLDGQNATTILITPSWSWSNLACSSPEMWLITRFNKMTRSSTDDSVLWPTVVITCKVFSANERSLHLLDTSSPNSVISNFAASSKPYVITRWCSNSLSCVFSVSIRLMVVSTLRLVFCRPLVQKSNMSNSLLKKTNTFTIFFILDCFQQRHCLKFCVKK